MQSPLEKPSEISEIEALPQDMEMFTEMSRQVFVDLTLYELPVTSKHSQQWRNHFRVQNNSVNMHFNSCS